MSPHGRELAAKAFETLVRVGIGGLFVHASLFKLLDPRGFAILVAQYQLLPVFHLGPLNNLFALVLPQFELWFGLMMVFTPYVREAAFALFWMLVLFMTALAWALAKDLDITCGCFELAGAMDKAGTRIALIRDAVLLCPLLWLMSRRGRSLIAVWRKRDRPPAPGTPARCSSS